MRFSALSLILMLLLSGCSGPVSAEVTPSSIPALPRASQPPAPSRTPFPPPTRRAPPPTEIPTFTAVPSLTPLPPPFVYVFPIQPPGAATYAEGTQGHGYPATDLFAQVGTKFVAVTDGVVEFVSVKDEWQPGSTDSSKRSGLAVAIIGKDGWRYYGSHLSAVVPGLYSGMRVKAGQVLGYVGASGDAVGKTPHLHFGISHPTYPADWKARRGQIDPFPYLNRWKEGQNLTPKDP